MLERIIDRMLKRGNNFKLGDRVKVLRGKFKGKYGKIIEVYGGDIGVLVQLNEPKAIQAYSKTSIELVKPGKRGGIN